MKRVICQQVPSLTDAELEMVVGGKGYDGCKSKPEKLHKAMTGKGNKPKDKDWSGGCNSKG